MSIFSRHNTQRCHHELAFAFQSYLLALVEKHAIHEFWQGEASCDPVGRWHVSLYGAGGVRLSLPVPAGEEEIMQQLATAMWNTTLELEPEVCAGVGHLREPTLLCAFRPDSENSLLLSETFPKVTIDLWQKGQSLITFAQRDSERLETRDGIEEVPAVYYMTDGTDYDLTDAMEWEDYRLMTDTRHAREVPVPVSGN